MMTYNILNYRNGTTYCTGNNNNSGTKEAGISTIVQYAQPDLIVFNELGSNPNNATYLLNNALNAGGSTNWSMVPHAHNGFSSLVNAIAYNADRLELQQQWGITKDLNNANLVRLIDVAHFLVKDSLWATTSNDTTDFYVIAVHFKAGDASSDQTERDLAAAAVIDWIDNNITEADPNVFILGDFNVYTSNESAYQTLVGGSSFRFEDPVNSSGNWHNSSSFAALHTQSTSTATSGCKSGGGLDDRFDQILISEAVSEGEAKMTYANNTYITIGNDGNHFNNAVNSGTNYSASAAVIDAVASVSDHLPVILDVDFVLTLSEDEHTLDLPRIPNPMPVGTHIKVPRGLQLSIMDLTGRTVHQSSLPFHLPALPAGTYLFKWTGTAGASVQKIIVL